MKKLNKKATHPIGVFDSGLGGLTVVKELIRQLPKEDIVYYGDTARVPYGTKSKEAIIRFSKENMKVLLKKQVKLVVVACNSSSSYALSALQRNFSVPVLGVISPGAKKAVEVTKNNSIGVVATSATIESGKYAAEIKRLKRSIKVYGQACPLFVPLAEEGWQAHPVSRAVADHYLASLKRSGIDTLILGCTHYPLLKKTIQQSMKKGVTLVDSAEEVAAKAKELLREKNLLTTQGRKGRLELLVSDRPQKFMTIAKTFLGRSIKQVRKV